VLDAHHRPGEATLRELIAVLEEGPEEFTGAVTLGRDNHERYPRGDRRFASFLVALVDGALGSTFASRTHGAGYTLGPLVHRHFGHRETDENSRPPSCSACWARGSAPSLPPRRWLIAGIEPQRNFFIVLDELWRVLRPGKGWSTG